MPIRLPDFDRYHLLQLAVCACPKLDNPRISEWLDGLDYKTVRQAGEGDRLYIRRFGDLSGQDHGHFHLEAARQSLFRRPLEADERLDAVLDSLGPLEGLTIGTSVFAKFIVQGDDLPKRGVIATLLGASESLEVAQLVVMGCEMAVRGDVPYSKVGWHAAEEGKEIVVDIQGRFDVLMDDNVLVSAAENMYKGLETLVLGRHSERKNGEE